jgi:hypothetical protein
MHVVMTVLFKLQWQTIVYMFLSILFVFITIINLNKFLSYVFWIPLYFNIISYYKNALNVFLKLLIIIVT